MLNSKEHASDWIEAAGLIAIVRGDHAAHIHELAEGLYTGGIRAMEITTNSPDSAAMIATLAARYDGKMRVGAGTVLTVDHVEMTARNGGTFIVSPDTYPPVIERALALGLTPIPGAYTASEIRAAVRAGARHIKLFPAMPAGPGYLKQLRGPLADVAFVPTGGITLDTIPEFIRAGAVAFGLGSSLVLRGFTGDETGVEEVRKAAEQFVAVLKQARSTYE